MAEDGDIFDDDLFEFDELVVDDVEPEPEAPAPTVGETLAAASAGEEEEDSFEGLGDLDDLPQPTHAIAAATALLDDQVDDEEYHPVVVASAGMPPIVVPLLLVMAFANLALVGLTWKSLGKSPEAPPPAAVDFGFASGQGIELAQSEPEPVDLALRNQLPELTSSRDDAWAILEESQRAIDAGEFTTARRALYSMLTVVDRIDAADRADLESRSGFLIAESYRLQAKAMGASEASETDASMPEDQR